MKKLIFLFCLIFPILIHAQIVGDNGDEIEEVKEKKELCDTCDYTTFYINFTGQQSYRNFDDNSVYGIYDEWTNQIPDYNFGVNAGMRMDLTKNLVLDIGLSYFGHGEVYKYEEEGSDTLNLFRNRYMQLAVPLKLNYQFGDKFQPYIGLGVMPSSILNIRYDRSTRKNGQTEVQEYETEIIKDGFNPFVIYGLINGGIKWNVTPFFGLNLGVDYRYSFSNTYSGTTKMLNHFMKATVLSLGIHFKI